MIQEFYLLIWETLEGCRFFAIPSIEKDAEWYILQQANGNDDGEYAWKLNTFLKPVKYPGNTLPGKWVQYEISVSELVGRPFVGAYKSGVHD